MCGKDDCFLDMFTDEWYNALQFEDADGEELRKILPGCEVLDAAPVDYPNTDGMTWTLRDPNGRILVVQTGSDAYNDKTGFELKIAYPTE